MGRGQGLPEARIDALRESFSLFRSTLTDPTEPPNEAWLRSSIVMESMLGPRVMGADDEGEPLWTMRLDISERVIDRAKAEGRADHLDVMLWEAQRAYWLARVERYADAAASLDDLLARWEVRIGDGDLFIRELAALRAAARYGAVLAESTSSADQIAAARAALVPHLGLALPRNLREVVDTAVHRAVRRGTQ